MEKRQKVIVILGPTASGKSSLAVQLARKLGGEVISADSRQVYRGLDIGTGKITKREAKGVPHHLLDVASPKTIFTAHDFVEHGRRAIEEIAVRGKIPIIAGGTGFYIDALVGRIVLPNVPIDKHLRARLEKKTPAQLLSMLKKRDSLRASSIDPHNKHRLVRALEIVSSLGSVPRPTKKTLYDVLWMGIAPSVKDLEQKIKLRLTARIKQGMLTEAKRLHSGGLSYKRMEALGLEYRYLARLLQKKISRQVFEEELFKEIRRYAKRQMTYWKRNKEIHWYALTQKTAIVRLVKDWLG